MLGPIIEELSVSPSLISRIVDGQIDEHWARSLLEVDKRFTAYQNNAASSGQSKAWSDLGPLLEKLVQKVSRSSL